MSNQAAIALTRFQDLNRDGSVSYTSYGLRVYDDHGSTYDNVLIETEEQLLALSDAEIVSLARGLNDIAASIIDHAEENADGIEIWGEFVSWKELGKDGPSA